MLNKRATYGDDWGVPSAEHPAGECLNRSAPGVEDGSYFEKAWVNDLMALPGAIMNAAGYTPNGSEDTATASQVFDALVNGRWSAIANYTAGTIVTASNGKQYYCKQDNGRDSTVLDPSTAPNRNTWVQYPYEEGSNSNGVYRIHYDDSIEQWGSSSTGSGTVIQNYPIPFLSVVTHVSPGYTSNQSGGVEYIQIVNKSNLENFTAVGYVDISTGSAVGNIDFSFYAKGV